MWEPILPGDPYGCTRDCKLDTGGIAALLAAQGLPVEETRDPGRFVCNYVYYRSLTHTADQPGQVQGLTWCRLMAMQRLLSCPPHLCDWMHVPACTVL
jgi:hypothetical protein